MLRRCLCFLVIVFASANADAADAGGARHYVDAVGREVLAVVNGAQGGASGKQALLQQMFQKNVDIPWMGRFVLGNAWASATPQQRRAYLKAYTDYLLAVYTTHFTEYSGSGYRITSVDNEGNGRFRVHMQIDTPGQEATDAGYDLQSSDSRFTIHDIIIEGVSMITTQRSEFASVVQRDGVSGLIRQLQAKTAARRQA